VSDSSAEAKISDAQREEMEKLFEKKIMDLEEVCRGLDLHHTCFV
jgi:hypothetical protein